MSDTGRRHLIAPSKQPAPIFSLVALGLGLALLEIFLGFFPAGAGHGWGGPIFVSFPLVVVLPILFVRFRIGTRKGWFLDLGIVGLAVAADYFLLKGAFSFRENVSPIHDESFLPGVVRSVLPFFFVWLIIWCFCQWVAMLTLVRHLLPRAPEVDRS
ncbi:hypothetical protein [Sphingomonas sp. LY160]|uniref:hypothetical protein n=1 Tax=Sphingomonas sp. LY160 TaxID=3095342 RepID=UPI002ADED31C|nr:hypothetical protein [Sphingomonas sp. LY160]MEA1071883.1 hypothetical protein [Sphingomonas sp. LY160]